MRTMIPNQSNENVLQESSEGNVWNFYTWKRSNMMFITILITLAMLGVMYFSFSEWFGTNIWMMLGVLKITVVFVEYFMGLIVEDMLLLAPFSICMGVVISTITLGADDFLDFLNAYFIEIGIQMFERTYLVLISGLIINFLENLVSRIALQIRRLFQAGGEKRDNQDQILAAIEDGNVKMDSEEMWNRI